MHAVLERERRVGSVSRCRWCAATATFLLAVHVCSVCKEEGGKIEGLVRIILQARPVRWVSVRPCTACIAKAGLIYYPNAGSHSRTGGPGVLEPVTDLRGFTRHESDCKPVRLE